MSVCECCRRRLGDNMPGNKKRRGIVYPVCLLFCMCLPMSAGLYLWLSPVCLAPVNLTRGMTLSYIENLYHYRLTPDHLTMGIDS